MDPDIKYYIAFSYLLGVGPVTLNVLLNHFETIKEAYVANKNSLSEILTPSLVQKIITFRNSFEIEKELSLIKKSAITVITRADVRYPKQLLQLADAPICLYIKGNINSYDLHNDLLFAVVGTRKPTIYGEQVARKFSYELAKEGFIIVSGLALGIDAIAHTAALDANGKTIAFLGCGVNIEYPPANRSLYRRILDNDGLIISEFPPQMNAQPGLFVQRNRLISGISKGIFVAEGLKDSGSLITARFAAEQGKDVFASPAPITSELSQAPNMLIKEGAKLVTCIEDILEEYSISGKKEAKISIIHLLSEEEIKVYNILVNEPTDSDELARKLKVPIYKILTTLSELELKNVILKKGGVYSISIH